MRLLVVLLFIASSLSGYSQVVTLGKENLQASNVSVLIEKLGKKNVVKVIKDSAVHEFDEATFAKVRDVVFTDGTIDVNVLSRLAPDAPAFARGFIGIAFRINDDNSKFECIYLRPTNGRADDQVRRNHSIQYFAFPDYKFARLRKESPEKYESYADMGLNEWIRIRIVVKGSEARLYLNDQKQPSLVVKDLKLGGQSGAVGLWVDVGTEGYFADLKVSK